MMIRSRSENRLYLVNKDIVKESKNIEKILEEFLYYKSIPFLSRLFFVKPKTLLFSKGMISYKTKYLGKNSISEITFNGYSIFFAKYIFLLIQIYLKLLTTISLDKNILRSNSEKYFIQKTKDRVDVLKTNNLNLCLNPDELVSRLENVWTKSFNDDRSTYKIKKSHGDLCLSNIIFYRGTLKLIDPRGASSLWLDEYYDLAKLSQCILGGYDYILEDLPIKEHPLKPYFLKMVSDSNLSLKFLRLCEAALFISMTPIHKESADRINNFLLAADKIISEYE